MLYIFTIKERVLGVCDYEHLKENTEKIWNESRENGEENDVVVYGVEKINSLEELMDFFNKVNEEIVLRKSWIDNRTPCLEIYDDYRE